MSLSIEQYELNLTYPDEYRSYGEIVLSFHMPKNGKILSIKKVRSQISVWAMVDKTQEPKRHSFLVISDGIVTNDIAKLPFLGTLHYDGFPPEALHIFGTLHYDAFPPGALHIFGPI